MDTSDSKKRYLYHYTGIEAVASIIHKKQLLLTNISYLNDKSELLEGLQSIEQVIEAVIQSRAFAYEYEVILIQRFQYVLKSIVEEFEDSLSPVFTCSFSSSPDDLSQWRAYGNYAIKFDFDILKDTIRQFNTTDSLERAGSKPYLELQDCLYDKSVKIKMAMSVLKFAIESLPKFHTAESVDLNFVYHLFQSSSAIFKHNSFVLEQEVRLQADYVHPAVPFPKAMDNWHWYNSDSINFNFPRNGHLVPRYSLNIPLEAIKSIQVGPIPDQKLARKSLEIYVKKQLHLYRLEQQLTHQEFNHTITVTSSETPFKG